MPADPKSMTTTSMATTAIFLATWIWVFVDVVLTDPRFVRHGPKFCWVTFVAVLPILGPAGWMLFGRPMVPVRIDGPSAQPTVGPEDHDRWLGFIADR